jgi:hypothetical protein
LTNTLSSQRSFRSITTLSSPFTTRLRYTIHEPSTPHCRSILLVAMPLSSSRLLRNCIEQQENRIRRYHIPKLGPFLSYLLLSRWMIQSTGIGDYGSSAIIDVLVIITSSHTISLSAFVLLKRIVVLGLI